MLKENILIYFSLDCIDNWLPKCLYIQYAMPSNTEERYAGCFSFIVSPNKPISYKLFPYLLCHIQLPRKTAGKQSVNSKQPISTEQCAIPRRERARGGEGWGEGSARERSCSDAAKRLKEKRKEELLKVTERKSCVTVNMQQASCQLFQRIWGFKIIEKANWFALWVLSFQEHLYMSESQKLPSLFTDHSSHTWS